MATTEQWHDMVTASIGGKENYGRGIANNPWIDKQLEWERRKNHEFTLQQITNKIRMIFEPRFITSPETCELMASLVTMIGAKQILELGMCTGFGTLHLLRAIIGIPGARVTSIDARPAHDRDFFSQPFVSEHFRFIEGWTPEALKQLAGETFQFVFVDSAHDLEHTQQEVAGLQPLIARGSMLAFHDVPSWRTPTIREEPAVRVWLRGLIETGQYQGLFLSSPRQLDCIEEYGDPNYPIECSPGLAVLIRR